MKNIFSLKFLYDISVISPFHFIKVRYYKSALFVTGERAHKTVSVLTPHIDFEERLKDIEKLKNNIKSRKLNINIDKLKELWHVLKDIEKSRVVLESKRKAITENIKLAQEAGNEEEISKLKVQGKFIRDDLRGTMKSLWGVQENVILKVLSLPNDLHSDVPSDEAKVLSEFKDCPGKCNNQIRIGKNTGLVRYCNPMSYYLESKAALYELKILQYFSQELNENNFIYISNADFCQSIVIEGCGLLNSNSQLALCLKTTDTCDEISNSLHLVGGASLPSFCAYFAKNIVSSLPAKYVSVGRQYNVPTLKDVDKGLLNVCQASAVEFFIAFGEESSSDAEFVNVLNIIVNLYERLGHHFRVVLEPAKCLQPWENKKVSIQLFSPKLKSYIEVGNISNVGDYISKRLLMSYKVDNDIKYLKIISGTVVSVPKLLACLIEQTDVLDVPGK